MLIKRYSDKTEFHSLNLNKAKTLVVRHETVKSRSLTESITSQQKNEFLGNEVGPRVRTANISASTCTSPPVFPRVRACGTPNPTSLWPEYLSSLKF